MLSNNLCSEGSECEILVGPATCEERKLAGILPDAHPTLKPRVGPYTRHFTSSPHIYIHTHCLTLSPTSSPSPSIKTL